jgi:iron(III) transport system substrate-binding protein
MKAWLSFFCLYHCLCFPSGVLAQDAKLIAEAKKEGKIVIYGSLETDIFDGIKNAFEAKFAIPIDYWRAAGATVMERTISERKAGKPLYDVVINNAGPMEVVLKEGIFAKYISPTSKNFAKESIHPEMGPTYRTGVVGIIYNKSILTPETAPKSLEDLLKPEFKSKLAFPDPVRGAVAAMWPASLYKIMGKDKAEKYIRSLAATKPLIVEGVLNAAERVSTGETPIGISYLKYVVLFGQRGAPLDYVRLDKMLGHRHHIALSNRALHPNAGKAFIDFFLDDESMRIMASKGEFVTRKGIYPPLADADKIQVVQMDELDAAGFAEKGKEYRKLFLQ